MTFRKCLTPKSRSWATGVVLLVAFYLGLTIVGASQEATAKTVRMVPESFSNLSEMVSPSVVNIRTVKTVKGGGRVFRHFFRGPRGEDPMEDFFRRFFDDEDRQREFKQRSLGSGFFISKKGFIVTNNHVVENADKIQVILKSGKEYDAEIVGRDPNTDIALIKVTAKDDFPVVTLGNSAELKVGQWVVAIGSPFGLEHTVTAGIVSAKGRVIGSGPYDDFIQTDASINPGNSGGPLIDMQGKVVGINTAIIAGGQGIGFAIPIDLAGGIIEQLQAHGSVTRGWLGVAIQNVTDEMAAYYGLKGQKGVLVTEVFPGDPADRAGVKAKDIITAVDSKKVETSRELTRMIAGISVGSKIKIDIWRDGKKKTLKVKIAKRDEDKIASRGGRNLPKEDSLGIRVTQLTPEMANRFNHSEQSGVLVTRVEPDGAGDKAGVRAGDIVKEIDHADIRSVDDYKKAINKAKEGETIKMFIWRRDAGFLLIKIEK